MEVTTIKLYKSTKFTLDSLRENNETYDDIITKIIIKLRDKNLKMDLIEAYKKTAERDLKIVNEWENASKELE